MTGRDALGYWTHNDDTVCSENMEPPTVCPLIGTGLHTKYVPPKDDTLERHKFLLGPPGHAKKWPSGIPTFVDTSGPSGIVVPYEHPNRAARRKHRKDKRA